MVLLYHLPLGQECFSWVPSEARATLGSTPGAERSTCRHVARSQAGLVHPSSRLRIYFQPLEAEPSRKRMCFPIIAGQGKLHPPVYCVCPAHSRGIRVQSSRSREERVPVSPLIARRTRLSSTGPQSHQQQPPLSVSKANGGFHQTVVPEHPTQPGPPVTFHSRPQAICSRDLYQSF